MERLNIKMKKNKVSVAITTYNSAKFITEQIESICNQTIIPDEIIISDDCSNDDTLKIINYLKNKFNNVYFKIIINNKNIGFIKNFELALNNCTGDIIFLSDHDDVWLNNKIERIIDIFNANNNILLIIHDAKLVDSNLNWGGVTVQSQIRNGFKNTDPVIVGALTVLKREYLNIILPFPDNIIGHDAWIHDFGRIINVRLISNEILQLIRRHESNTSNWIASSTKKINSFDTLYYNLKTNPAENYNNRLYIYEVMKERIYKIIICKDNKINFNKNNLEKAIFYLNDEYNAIIMRNAIVKSFFIKRIYYSLKMLIKGHYIYFNGFHSFLRDIIRL